MVHFKFVESKKDGCIVDIQAETGRTLLDVALANNIDIEGACGGFNTIY